MKRDFEKNQGGKDCVNGCSLKSQAQSVENDKENSWDITIRVKKRGSKDSCSSSKERKRGKDKLRVFFILMGIIILLILLCVIILWKMNPELLYTLVSIAKRFQAELMAFNTLGVVSK